MIILDWGAVSLLRPVKRLIPPIASAPCDAVLRLGRGLTEQMISARERSGLPIRIYDIYQKNEDEILETVCRLCREGDRPLIVAAKNDERLCEELSAARQRGKRIVTLVADLNPSARDVFIGIDNRMAGQTAAFLIGGLVGGRLCEVGVIVGDYAFRCHEDREIGFRAYLRLEEFLDGSSITSHKRRRHSCAASCPPPTPSRLAAEHGYR